MVSSTAAALKAFRKCLIGWINYGLGLSTLNTKPINLSIALLSKHTLLPIQKFVIY